MSLLTFIFCNNLNKTQMVTVKAATLRHAMFVASDKLKINVCQVVRVA